MPPRRILDSHVHLIEPTRFTYPWMEQAPSLRRPFTPVEFRAATAGIPITEMIFIEVTAAHEHSLGEVGWVQSLRTDEPRLKGTIARALLGDERGREAHLSALASRPGV